MYGVCDYRQEHGYNSSQSSTYKEAGRYSSSKFNAVNYGGFLSYDTIRLGDVNVTDYLFEEWTSASCYSIGCLDGGYDGVLGLAPPWGLHQDHPNILSALLSQKVLDAPVFSMKLPIGFDDEGEILLGGMNTRINSSSLIDLPVVNATGEYLFHDQWTVPASHISFDSSHPLEYSLPASGYALLDTASPYLILPSELARNMTAAIGAEPGPAWFYNIPCERRQELPALTFTLAGHEFSISAFEYTIEIRPPEMPLAGFICVSTFMAADEFGVPKDWEGMVLGSPFLRGWYSVWDLEERKVGLANLK